MLSFIEFCEALLPALKHRKTGETLVGGHGQEHFDVYHNHKVHDDFFKGTYEHGFHDPVSKKFHARNDIDYETKKPKASKTQEFRKQGWGEFLKKKISPI